MRKEAEPDHPLGGTAAFFEFNCTAVEVEVDRETGDVTVTRHVTVSDVGKALHANQVRGQDEGAAIMGLGHTLMEQLVLADDGRIRNLGAIDYRIPTSMDLPQRMESDSIQNEDGPGPYGAKGMSEGALLCVAPAVAAAVRDATGVVIRELPLTPERVWRALRDAETEAEAEAEERGAVSWTVALDDAYAATPEDATATRGRQGREPRGDGARPRVAGSTRVRDHDQGVSRIPRERLAGRPGRRAADPDGRRRDGRRATLRRRRGPAARECPVGCPGLDAGDDGHHPDLGLNDATTDGLARASGDESFAAACRDRFEQSFRSIVAVDEVPVDPWTQLRLAVEAVFRSWNGGRARAYRAKEGIDDDLGTGVTVQAMVFGNRGETSGTGVVFTRNPATGEPGLYGDVLFDAQGEDVVAGTHATESVAALDERLPGVASELRDVADRLERHYRDLCDIEFNDRGRPAVAAPGPRRQAQPAGRAADRASTWPRTRRSRFRSAEAVERVRPLLVDPPRTAIARDRRPCRLLRGLPASPGVASGPIVTDPEAAVRSAQAASGRRAILVRAETSPDDVHGMAAAAGILTSRGGLASHAAVVARGWGIPAVVGATELEVAAGRIAVGSRTFPVGDDITIDGSTGEVFEGAIAGTEAVVPEAATLLAWARDLGIAIDQEGETVAAGGATGVAPLLAGTAAPRPRDQGLAQRQALADALLTTPNELQPVLDGFVAEGSVSSVAGAYRLTDAGTAMAAAALEGERDAWGRDRADAALGGFLALDGRMKSIVTAWQLRDVDAQVINDHTDADYDREVLERLAALHANAVAWLVPLEAQSSLLAGYHARLDRAAEQAIAGDGRFVASPRVDSYHGAWFELHEELIQLAGRTRADEVAAGRA
jgi:pyruvate,orthophosphate dikinase